jgi:hypothetical protein
MLPNADAHAPRPLAGGAHPAGRPYGPGNGDDLLGSGPFLATDGPDEIAFFEAVLAPLSAAERGFGVDDMPPMPHPRPGLNSSEVEQQVLPVDASSSSRWRTRNPIASLMACIGPISSRAKTQRRR